MDVEEYNCSVCLRLYYNPVKLECKHFFCGMCLKRLLRSNQNKACPLCRFDLTDFDQENAHTDKEMKKTIKEKFPQQYKERKQEHLAEMEDEKHKILKKTDCRKRL
eukprot:TRINITY_DN6296_c0_g1_i2.p2 TRINITY_DN6296_c0_g1~~TRINITY_DN6296_c0_g1_i2.p2  ORF type:complete len:106 (-),score=15.58 TRINITY_DN6296_c0_g1_i2:573-890(-)